MTLKTRDIVDILEQLNHSQCQDFQLTLGEDSLRLSRSVDGRPAPSGDAPREIAAPGAVPQPAAPQATAEPSAAPQSAATPSAATPASAAPVGDDAIAAPMGGVFYRCPSPDEPPFVEEGAEVKAGDPVCVIEVMKLFSTVYAERDGRIAAIHVDDGDSIEKDQLLFSLEPAGGGS